VKAELYEGFLPGVRATPSRTGGEGRMRDAYFLMNIELSEDLGRVQEMGVVEDSRTDR